MNAIHYRPLGWAQTACRISPLKWAALISTALPSQVTCRGCAKLIRNVVGEGAMHADAIREMTVITHDLVTKADIAELRAVIEDGFRQLAEERRAVPDRSKLIDAEACAAYIGRSPGAVYMLVHRGVLPHVKVGRLIQFDPVTLDRWIERHKRRGRVG